jgi:hypothetical protein
MEQKFYSFPDIEQFRSVIHAVHYRTRITGKDENGDAIFDESIPLPTLKFRGSVKLHGTNAGIIFAKNDEGIFEFYVQSRSNIITPVKDNAGFATFVGTNPVWKLLELLVIDEDELDSVVRIYGEWCGGSVQKGVALNKLDKMFVIFAIKVGERWVNDNDLKEVKLPENKIYNILDYPTYEIEIDFNDPKFAANKMGELVEEVEKECPVGKAFGVEGVGEGIVWMCQTEGWEGSRFWFKTKGDEHKGTKTKEKVPIDVERVNSMKALVEIVVTEPRLLQGIDYLRQENIPIERKNLGVFLKWVFNDVVKEELETIVANGFEPKEISGAISNKARDWFFKLEDSKFGI